ncbi:xyloglucan endotransglucosylase/hydrolase protein 2-like [Senna tora]|uniref:Xyloglucan endotransglucosylase/hydrolase n=1 Tax=Senna tora TaxID=362788 RepID=A0A834XHV9_9FABA|nr:xyloglucan endotransglucosylase/hydrolase protein 2-like [Senna tora]
MSYGSGFFHLWIKVPGGDSSGVVTAFYLSSRGERHDEIDMEFLGNKEGKPYTLQTNVYVDGEGGREQRLRLWFDPSAYFHNYRILWNSRHIVFFVDNIPIRIFKNKSDVGGRYPSQAMRIEATIWNGDDWATDGGRSKINLKYAPFKAYFQGFDIRACELVEAQRSSSSSNARNCSSDRFAWNKKIFWKLDPGRQRVYNAVRKKYMTYDYCADRPRFPTPPKECI